MKVKFTKLAALLLAGVALFATGCTDYEVDIQRNADAIANANQQIAALQATIATLETAANHDKDIKDVRDAMDALKTALQTEFDGKINKAVADLTAEINKKVNQADYDVDKAKIEKALKDLNDALDAAKARIKALEDADFQGQIDAAKTRIKALEDADFQGQIDAVKDRVSACENLLAGDWDGKTVKQTIDAVAKSVADLETAMNGKIEALEGRMVAAENAIKEINEVTIPGINDQITELKNTKVDTSAFNETKRVLSKAIENLQALTAGFPEGQTIKDYVDAMDASLKAFVEKELEKYATLADLAAVKAELAGRIKVCEDLLTGDWGGKTVQEYIDAKALELKNAIDLLKEAHEKDVKEIKALIDQVKNDVLAVKGSIRSLVFVPEVYVDGVEAILINTLKYPTQTIEDEVYNTADEVAVESEDSVLVSPKVIAKYHVIPSNADLSFLEENPEVKFVIRPDDPFYTIRTRAASEGLEVSGKYIGKDEEEQDVILIEVEVVGTPATDESISVVALQLTNGDETYTSDYATVFSQKLDDLRIAMPADEDYHYRRALEEVAGISALDAEAGIPNLEVYIDTVNVESCDTSLVYDTPLDLLTITEAHVIAEAEDECRPIEASKLNLDWKFELVDIEDWEVGAIDEITLSGEKNNIITASIEAMDLTPVVRTYLVNEDEENAQIAYIKFYVAPQDFDAPVDMGEFTFSCDGDSLKTEEVNIYEQLHMTKETFERVYPNFMTEDPDAEADDDDDDDEEEEPGFEVTFDPETGILQWKATAEWLWNNAVDEEKAPGEPLTTEVYFVNPNNGAKITVKLSALPAVIQAYKIPYTKYITNYWDLELTYSRYNVATPGLGETDNSKCVFHNNINAAFVTKKADGVIDLTGIGMEGLEVSNIKYFFCDDMAVNADGEEIVTKIGDYDVIFSIEDGEGTRTDVNGTEFDVTGKNTILLAKLADDEEAEPVEIAYICNNADEKDKTPNVVVLVKDEDPNHLAKKLLNTDELFVLLGATGMICGDEGFEVNLLWQSAPLSDPDGQWLDHFRANYIQPVKVTDRSKGEFTDAVDFGQEGSFITLKDLIAPHDWRLDDNYPSGYREFGMNEGDQYYNYWDYYGIFFVDIKEEDIKCDLPGVVDGEVPTTILLKKMYKQELLSNVNPDAEMRNPDGTVMKDEDGNVITIGDYINAIDDGGYGFLTYRNNGTAVKEFNLFVPVTVQYGWGFITTDEPITVPVNSTIG
jgi:hypothetical protein